MVAPTTSGIFKRLISVIFRFVHVQISGGSKPPPYKVAILFGSYADGWEKDPENDYFSKSP